MGIRNWYEALITDLDGTLLPDSEVINQKAVIETMHNHGFELRLAEIEGIPGHPSSEIIPRLLATRSISSNEIHQRIIEENRKRYDDLWDREVEFSPAIKNTLLELHERGIPIAIATTNRNRVVAKFLDRFSLRETVSVVVGGDDVTHMKPSPEVYILAGRQLGEKRCLAAEDTPIGVRSARAAGIHCAAIPNQYSARLDFSEATYTLQSFSDLLQFF